MGRQNRQRGKGQGTTARRGAGIEQGASAGRRGFLRCCAVVVSGGVLLEGCGRGSGPTRSQGAGSGTVEDDAPGRGAKRPGIPSAEPAVRVRIVRVRGRGEEGVGFRAGGEGELVIVREGSGVGRGMVLRGPVQVTVEGGALQTVDATGLRGPAGGRVEVLPERPGVAHAGGGAVEEANGSGGAMRLEHRDGTGWKAGLLYPGWIEFVLRSDFEAAAVDVINHVGVEAYLPGVLAGELYRGWNVETFAAQAVAARSYAYTEAAVFQGSRHFDLSASTASQMYLGTVRHERASLAVRMTRGLMLAQGSKVVSGYYSSCCGGLAASAGDAFGDNEVNAANALAGRAGRDVCEGAPVFRWKANRPEDDLARRMRAWGKRQGMARLAGLKDIGSIEVAARNAHGRASRMAVEARDGTVVEVSAEQLRMAGNEPLDDGASVGPGEVLRSSEFTARVANGAVGFDGRGYGHGVGLCQHGAQALAAAGKAHGEILRWYYPGVELVKAY